MKDIESNCNYIKKQGYPLKYNNNSFNSNDIQGFIMLTLFMIFIVLLIFMCYNKFQNHYYNIPCVLVLIIIIILVATREIRMLYMISYILNCHTRTPPFLDKKIYFPNYIHFETHYPQIKQELLNLLKLTNGGKDISFMRDFVDKKENEPATRGTFDEKLNKGWKMLGIKSGNRYASIALKIFPNLCNLIKKYREITSVSISILDDKTYIPIHRGYYKGFMRFMLPLIVPKDKENVFLCNNYEKYIWTEGVGVLWDDNFPHKVINNTDEIRVMLFMDIERPYKGFLKTLNKIGINGFVNSKSVKNEIKRTEKKYKL